MADKRSPDDEEDDVLDVVVDDEDDKPEVEAADDTAESDEGGDEKDEAPSGKPKKRDRWRERESEWAAERQKFAAEQAKRDREIEELREKLGKIETDQSSRSRQEDQARKLDKAISDLQGRRKDLLKQRRAAEEAGDLEKRDDIDEQINDVRLDIKIAEHRKANPQQAPKQERGREPPAPRAPARREPPPGTQAWLDRNSWFRKPGHEAETGAAIALDQALASEGFDASSPDYFTELDRRLHDKFPSLKPAERTKRPATTAPGARTMNGGATKKSVRLSQGGAALAEELGLLKDKDRKQALAKNIREAEEADERRRANR